jgi:Holliday junction DNA helicase RuvA
MIGSLRGRLMFKQASHIVLECNGVGYEVETPMSTFLDLPAVGSELFLHLFRTLLKVNRVGAKMALGVLSSMSASDFRRCVEYEDAATLSKVPGIGKKTAERLIMEMRDKVDKVGTPSLPGGKVAVDASARSEAFDALVSLGYKANEVNKLLGTLDIDEQSAEDIIRHALKQAAK